MARQKREAKLRGMVNQMGTPSDVFEVIPEDEKPITLRLSLRKVAAELGVEVAIRKHGNGFLVGLMTPERRSNRGRRPVTAE